MWIKNWFSNMEPFDVPLEYEGVTYYAPENFYQAMKIPDENYKDRKYIAALHPRKAKTEIKKLKTMPWSDATKIMIMTIALRHKFQLDTSWGKKLLETGDTEIVEYNNWSDLWWGVDFESGEGRNELGKLLMQIRNELRMQQAFHEIVDKGQSSKVL